MKTDKTKAEKINAEQNKSALNARIRKLILLIMDGTLVCMALLLGVIFRFERRWPNYIESYCTHLAPILAFYLGALLAGGMYRRMWRYAGIRDLVALVLMTGSAGVLSALANGIFAWGMSRAMLFIMCIMATGLIGGARLGWRAVSSAVALKRKQKSLTSAPRLLIVGAGSAATYVLHMCGNDPSIGVPVVLVDDDPLKVGQWIGGIPVKGTTKDIAGLCNRYSVQEIIIAIPSLRGSKLNKLIMECKATKCRVRISMQIQRAKQAKNEAEEESRVVIRDLNTADFLSRDEVHLDNGSISQYLKGKRVIVTGGGGSIGSELCRQIIKYSPRQLIIFDIYENCAYELECELRRNYGADIPVTTLVGSIRDKARLEAVFEQYRPQVVFHAAAHKHVPLMETSPAEAVKNNVLGTRNLLEVADEFSVERFVQLSTDKAVNPTNIMGATKRITELLIQYFARKSQMKCMAVRFGNVLGSHGSVIPLFERQIKNGGPVTVTHPEITRFFMTIPEAAQLVLQAGGIAKSGAIFVLDMGEPVKIKELAEKLIRFYGYEPGKTMDIVYTGLRAGEKLYEELLTPAEKSAVATTAHQKIMIAPSTEIDDEAFAAQVESLVCAAKNGAEGVVETIKAIVPEYAAAIGRQ